MLNLLFCVKVTLLLGTISPGASEGLGDQVLDYNQRMSGEWRPVSDITMEQHCGGYGTLHAHILY